MCKTKVHIDIHHVILYQQLFFYLNLYNLSNPFYVKNNIYLIRFDKFVLNLVFL